MNSLMRKSAMPLRVIVAAAVFLILVIIMTLSRVTHADNGVTLQNGRLITIHDRGVENVILSQATTIGDALKEAGIIIDSKDAVEPAVTEKLVASSYQVNIYRVRPVIIVDGSIREKIVTPYQTAEQITKSANITLYPEDKTTIDRVDNISEGAGLQLIITRATPFSFDLYGSTTTARTQATTIGGMLLEKGIKLTRDDHVSPSPDTQITSGMAIRVWREGKQTITVSEVINFEVEQIKNADQPVGYTAVTAPGENGSRNVTYEITIQNGQEVSRTAIANIITKPATKQIEVVGAKGKYTTPSENQTITWNFLISNGFSRYQTAGIMGNLMQEHGFNTSDTSGGYGIVQWTGARRSELLSQPYPENIYTQLNFLMHELNTNYSSVRDTVKMTSTVDDATIIFQNKFERCGLCMQGNRIRFAYNILASF